MKLPAACCGVSAKENQFSPRHESLPKAAPYALIKEAQR